MYDERTLSLCVSVKSYQGKDMLYRVADLNDENELVPFFTDPSLPREGDNKNMIYSNPRDKQVEGSIYFWKWHIDGSRDISDIDTSGLSWIEYIRIGNISSLEELQLALFNGIDMELEPNRKYLIEYSRNNKYCLCVSCKASDFKRHMDEYVLIDNIYRLDCYEISNDRIYDINTNYLPKFNKRFYSHLDLPVKAGTVLVRTPADTVRQAILKRISRCTEGFSKADKRSISEFVRKLSSETIVGHIADECRCTIEEAEEYMAVFVHSCEKHFADDDFTSSTLLHLLEYNSEIGMKYQETIRAEWERQNAEKIEEADTKIKSAWDNLESDRMKIQSETVEAQKRLDAIRVECEVYDKEKTNTVAAIGELKKVYDKQINLADEVAQKIRDKMAGAENDLSSFLAEYALFFNKNSNSIIKQPSFGAIEIGKTITEDPETITTATELFEYLRENLEAVGVDKIFGSALAAYLLAAYFERIPLTIAGYGADFIIDAVSATLYNKSVDRLLVKVGADIAFPTKPDILAVHNGFGSMAKILNSTNSYLYFVAQTSEELLLEPRSGYNYALPLYTEYFITDNRMDDLYGTISDVKFDFRGKERKPSFPEHIVPILAYRNYQRLLGTTVKLHGDITNGDLLLLTALPLMLSLGKKEELIELLSSLALSDNEKAELYRRIGESE